MTFVIMTLIVLAQICGFNSVMVYMERILKNAGLTIVKPSLVVICNNVCGVVGSIISMLLIEKCGRRFLLVISSAGVSVSMFALSGHFFIMDKLPQWILVTLLIFFVISYFVGLTCVPTTILCETLPAEIKYFAAVIANVTAALVAFLSTKTYQPMVDLMGEKYVFLTYAILAGSIIPYTLLVIPETKGKSLQEIQDELMKK